MSEKASGASKRATSFERRAGLGRDLHRRDEWDPRAYFALVLAIVGAAAVAVAWSLDGHFRYATSQEAPEGGPFLPGSRPPVLLIWEWRTSSLHDLVVNDAAWAVCAASLSLAPFVYLWWRRSATDSLRWIGCALSLVPGAVTLWLTRSPSDYILDSGAPHAGPGFLEFASMALSTAFLVAPPPRARDE